MNTNTQEVKSSANVAELLSEMGEIEQEQHALALKARQTRAKLFELKKASQNIEEMRALKKEGHSCLMRMRYQTSNGLTVHKLRQAGCDVTVNHLRYVNIPGVKVKVPAASYLRGAFDFLPRGGATHITIVRPDGEWLCLSSVCHEADSFDYKMGVKTALEQLTDEEAQTLLAFGDTKVEA